MYFEPRMLARTSSCDHSFKIDKSAYRVKLLKTVKSAYRVDPKKKAGFTLDKSESLV